MQPKIESVCRIKDSNVHTKLRYAAALYISTVRPTVYTNLDKNRVFRKRSSNRRNLKNNAGFAFQCGPVWAENKFEKGGFENDDVTMIM